MCTNSAHPNISIYSSTFRSKLSCSCRTGILSQMISFCVFFPRFLLHFLWLSLWEFYIGSVCLEIWRCAACVTLLTWRCCLLQYYFWTTFSTTTVCNARSYKSMFVIVYLSIPLYLFVYLFAAKLVCRQNRKAEMNEKFTKTK